MDDAQLKRLVHQKLPRTDAILLLLHSFQSSVGVADLRKRATQVGLRQSAKWNVSSILDRSQGAAIRTSDGWELTDQGRDRLRSLGVPIDSPNAVNLALDLRRLLEKVLDPDTHSFIKEAVRCYESKLLRAAVVMSWLAAVHVLKLYVVEHHLVAFNNAAAKSEGKWKPAVTTDDLGLMTERRFLDRLQEISMIGQNVKNSLIHALDLRNGCGHPNSLKVGDNAVAHHIETIIQNVMHRFAA